MTALVQNTQDAYQNTVAQQNAAASPATSVWLAASAGTGKTEVLSKRLLRLLLDGNAPENILCLTYTKAAAAEMANRLARVLTSWVTLPRDKLFAELSRIGLGNATEDHIDRARALFALVLDCPGGLHIQTLHSFCQELLQRFPLEAGHMPHFTVLDDMQTAALHDTALTHLLQQVNGGNDVPLSNAFGALMATMGEHNFRTLLAEHMRNWDAGTSATAVANALGVSADTTAEAVMAATCEAVEGYRGDLQAAAQAYIDHAPDSKKKWGYDIAAFLAADAARRPHLWNDYCSAFLTAKGELKAATTYASKDLQGHLPRILDIMMGEGERVQRALEAMNAATIYQLTTALDLIAARYSAIYTEAKRQQVVLDYDDLIKGAEGLLTDAAQAAWVRYKLDNKLAHVLVDEAQDTSPAQWAILRALADEFIQDSDDTQLRTLFVVGDEKQSIYSFQGADPQAFHDERLRYQQDFAKHQKPFGGLSLTLSFRSAQAVLDVVNATFASDAVRAGVSDVPVLQEASSNTPPAGMVELWPLLQRAPAVPEGPWHLPLEREAEENMAVQLAQQMAVRIKEWLDNGARLPGRNRPIVPGDVMILLQKRTTLMEPVVRALKQQGIAVAGVDKMVLTDQLAVQDMLALVNFALLPTDDLNLAALLKTPLCGASEEALYNLCYKRNGSLWRSVQKQQPAIAEYLRGFLAARGQRPYEFLQMTLRQPCPANIVSGLQAFRTRLGDEVLDPLHELLQAALSFEQSETPNLQSFALALSRMAVEKKRDMSEAGNKVRVMTVHASKGLQAPIVILADAAGALNKSKQPLLLPGDPMLFVPRTGLDVPVTRQRRAAFWQRQDEEYRRLLYVAMTRAEEQLIVCGTTTNKEGTAPEGSWYALVQSTMQQMDVTTLDDGTLRYVRGTPKAAGTADEKATEAPVKLPEWATTMAVAEAAPMRPLAPSRITEPDVAYTSPLASDQKRFTSGIVTHRLLELLPNLPAAKQEAAAQSLLAVYKNELSDAQRNHIATSVKNILQHPEFAPLFGDGSMAEVPLVGMVGGQPISGQVDRLLVTEDVVLVVDYKTGAQPQNDTVPDAYLKQLASYARLLRKIYPGRSIKAALLWTDGARFMPIPESQLNS